MTCQKCGFALVGNEDECPSCGVIIAKARPRSSQPKPKIFGKLIFFFPGSAKRKLGALALGGVAMGIIYMLGVEYCQHLVQRTGRSPESYLWLAFLVFGPLACLVGGGVAGFLVGPVSGKPILDAILFSPGVYIGLWWLLSAFAGATRDFALSMIEPVLLWIAASTLGFLATWAMRKRGVT